MTSPSSFRHAFAFVLTGLVMNMASPASAFMVIAHRGDSSQAPENTLASIHSAVGKATDTEFDGRVTADGQLVLMHDSTVNRTTNGTGKVSDQTLAQVQALDAGSWFSPAFAGETAPTVTTAATTAIAAGLVPMVERKAGTAQQYLDALAGIENDVTLISFNLAFLTEVRALDDTIRLGHLGAGTLSDSELSDSFAAGVDFLSWHYRGINPDRLQAIHDLGLDVTVWTINDATIMQQYLDMGVDGIATDDPALLTSLIPEPTSIALLGAGLAAATRRNKRRPHTQA